MDAHIIYLLMDLDLPDSKDILFWTAFKYAFYNLLNL